MSSLAEVLRRADTLTFDCYGTLIDWRAGLTRSLRGLFGPAADRRMDELFAGYLQIEAEVEAEPYRPYREVLSEVVRRLANRRHRQSRLAVRFADAFEFPAERVDDLARSLPDWPPFADTNEALVSLKQRFRLGILSNIDRNLLAQTARRFDVAFDFVVTAEDVRSYKPGHAHFARLLSEHAERERVVHVAQSLFHDGVPTGELGIAYVWINRYNDVNTARVQPLGEYADLKSFAKVAEDE